MSPIKLHSFVIPKILMFFFVSVLVVSGVLYVSYQARFLLAGPQITLTGEQPTLQTDRQVKISGNTANITALFLNGRPIVTNENGVFHESVVLENGYSTVRIDAEDRYGRRTSVERSFVYTNDTNSLN